MGGLKEEVKRLKNFACSFEGALLVTGTKHLK
jgi:hypothetical protein